MIFDCLQGFVAAAFMTPVGSRSVASDLSRRNPIDRAHLCSGVINAAATLLLLTRPLIAFLPGSRCRRWLLFGGAFHFFVGWLSLCLRARLMLIMARFVFRLFAPGCVQFALRRAGTFCRRRCTYLVESLVIALKPFSFLEAIRGGAILGRGDLKIAVVPLLPVHWLPVLAAWRAVFIFAPGRTAIWRAVVVKTAIWTLIGSAVVIFAPGRTAIRCAIVILAPGWTLIISSVVVISSAGLPVFIAPVGGSIILVAPIWPLLAASIAAWAFVPTAIRSLIIVKRAIAPIAVGARGWASVAASLIAVSRVAIPLRVWAAIIRRWRVPIPAIRASLRVGSRVRLARMIIGMIARCAILPGAVYSFAIQARAGRA